MVSHGNLSNYAQAVSTRLAMSATDRVLQFASLSFDVAVEEIFPTLAAGGTVVLNGTGVGASFVELERILGAEQSSWVELPTVYWHEWVADLETRGARINGSLRQVIVGGEKLSGRRVEQWARTGVPLLHVFGLTETTTTTSLHQVKEMKEGSEVTID